MKIWLPPLLSKSPHFELWTFLFPALISAPPFELFSLFGTFLNSEASLSEGYRRYYNYSWPKSLYLKAELGVKKVQIKGFECLYSLVFPGF